ncbi:hypothetical protein [Achromobacter sp.]|uniref:hypothetical protein n=1 Tax=Achromobacter sp. TaxID=134375 RepID=UPI00258F38B8|nr:hypothetical protein [Achromobacter sp.]
MSLEDVADKARRNLMAVSSGIVAVWALKIPLDGRLVGAVDLNAVEPWRAWAAALVVLVYFALRHHFSPPNKQAWEKWANRRQAWFHGEIVELLEKSAEILSVDPKKKKPSRRLGWIVQPEKVIFNDLNLQPPQNGLFWVSRAIENVRRKRNAGSVVVCWERATPGTRSVGFGRTRGEIRTDLRYRVRAWTYHSLALRSWFRAYTPSWELLEHSVPWFVAFFALAVCVWRLAVSLYYEFPFVRQLLPA